MTKREMAFNELASLLSPEMKNWMIDIDKMLIEGGCSATVDIKKNRFTYTSKATKKIVCKFDINADGITVMPNGNHLPQSNGIIAHLPEHMITDMKNGKECGVCAKNNPNFIQCKHGGPYMYTIENKNYNRCRYYGFGFRADSSHERELLKEWIEMELAI